MPASWGAVRLGHCEQDKIDTLNSKLLNQCIHTHYTVKFIIVTIQLLAVNTTILKIKKSNRK